LYDVTYSNQWDGGNRKRKRASSKKIKNLAISKQIDGEVNREVK
jgi:hypothetical protein